MVIVRRRFPTPPAFRDNLWEKPVVQDFSKDLGPAGPASSRRTVGADTIGHMRPSPKANLAGMHAWTKSMTDGGLPEGQNPARNKGRGWKTMSLHGQK